MNLDGKTIERKVERGVNARTEQNSDHSSYGAIQRRLRSMSGQSHSHRNTIRSQMVNGIYPSAVQGLRWLDSGKERRRLAIGVTNFCRHGGVDGWMEV